MGECILSISRHRMPALEGIISETEQDKDIVSMECTAFI